MCVCVCSGARMHMYTHMGGTQMSVSGIVPQESPILIFEAESLSGSQDHSF